MSLNLSGLSGLRVTACGRKPIVRPQPPLLNLSTQQEDVTTLSADRRPSFLLLDVKLLPLWRVPSGSFCCRKGRRKQNHITIESSVSAELWFTAIFKRCTFQLVLMAVQRNSEGEDDFHNGEILNSRFFLFESVQLNEDMKRECITVVTDHFLLRSFSACFCFFCRPRARVCVCAWFSFSNAKLS